MSDLLLDKFQDDISEVLIRHKSILDIISKYQESCAKVNRAIVKSATDCGCVQINGTKQSIPQDISYDEFKNIMGHQVSGELCDICRDKIEEEMGNHLFYLGAICNALDLNLQGIIKTQSKNINTLGKYSLY